MRKFKQVYNKAMGRMNEETEKIDAEADVDLQIPEVDEVTPSRREETLAMFKKNNASNKLMDGLTKLFDLAATYEKAEKKDPAVYAEMKTLVRELEDEFHKNNPLVKAVIGKTVDTAEKQEEMFKELLGLDVNVLEAFKGWFTQHHASKKFLADYDTFITKAKEYQKGGKKDNALYDDLMAIGRRLDAQIYTNPQLLKSMLKQIGANLGE